MNGELWIWTELLAFDNTLSDFGVQEYLARIPMKPDGISILSGFDFILRHTVMDQERIMPPPVCSRSGHITNGKRNRQEWTNFQIRDLIKILQKHGVKVLISVFEAGMANFPEKEFSYENCPEHRYSFVGKLNDGRDAGKYFIEQMRNVLKDYGFDGWHAADNVAACWSILSDPTDCVIRDFAASHRDLGLPDLLLEDASGNSEKRKTKLRWLQENCWNVWNDFMLNAWMDFWSEAVGMVHEQGKIIMVNSPNTKSVFGALQYMSLDYRRLAELKIDYLLCETTSPSCELIWHTRPYAHEFDAVLSEMTASMPGVKVLIMPSVKDIVETYDALEHAPCLYERDLNLQTAQHIVRGGRLERCAGGLMVCLGDCIEEYEWHILKDLYERAFRFQSVRTGELVWLHDSAMFDPLREEHHRIGTWSPARQVNELRILRSIDISSIADVSELAHLTQPIIAFDFHLWSKEKQEAVLASPLPKILFGRFSGQDLPKKAEVIRWQDCACVFLNWKDQVPGVTEITQETQLSLFDYARSFSLYRGFYPHREMPEAFWKKAADRIRSLLGSLPLRNEDDGIQLVRQYAADGSELVMLVSMKHHYTVPVYEMPESGDPVTILSRYPKVTLGVRKGNLAVADPGRSSPVHIPPMGVLAFIR